MDHKTTQEAPNQTVFRADRCKALTEQNKLLDSVRSRPIFPDGTAHFLGSQGLLELLLPHKRRLRQLATQVAQKDAPHAGRREIQRDCLTFPDG